MKECSHQYWDLGRCIDCFKTQNQIDNERRESATATNAAGCGSENPSSPCAPPDLRDSSALPSPTAPLGDAPRANDDLGLTVDMLDVDRLRDWARLLLTHGADISHWGSVPHVASKMQILATNLEKAIRDIGALRAAAGVGGAPEESK